MLSNLDLACATDGFPYGDGPLQVQDQNIYKLMWEDENGPYAIGYMLERVVDEIVKMPEEITGHIAINRDDRTIAMFQLPSEEERTAFVAKFSEYLRDSKLFPILNGWRNEPWPVYSRKGELLFSMERVAMAIIGSVRYGVHLNAYVKDESAPHGMKIWVPKRAANKSTFPGMLDNTVAGGLMTGEDYFECVVREADEEASLPEDVVRANAHEVGALTYIYISDKENCGEAGYIFPEVEWAFDLCLPADVIPQPKDGEVEKFMLCDVDEIKRDLAAGKFKTNCALVMIDFFIRHGILTTDNEPELELVKKRMHRELPFPGPHQSFFKAA